MICLECKKTLKTITYRHLKYCCGLTPNEYKIKHNIKCLMDESVIKKCIHFGKENGNWKNGITKQTFYCKKCGIKIDKRSQSGLCHNCVDRSGINNPFYKKTHSEETKKHLKLVHKDVRGINNSFYGKSHSEKTKKHLSKKAKKRWKTLSKKERNQKILDFVTSGSKLGHKTTKIEGVVCNYLIELHLKNKYKQHYQISKYNVDFKIGNKLIECFGDYWHCNTNLFNENDYNKSLKCTAKEKWKKDKNKILFLNKKGFDVLVLWESDILNNFEFIKNKIKEFLDD